MQPAPESANNPLPRGIFLEPFQQQSGTSRTPAEKPRRLPDNAHHKTLRETLQTGVTNQQIVQSDADWYEGLIKSNLSNSVRQVILKLEVSENPEREDVPLKDISIALSAIKRLRETEDWETVPGKKGARKQTLPKKLFLERWERAKDSLTTPMKWESKEGSPVGHYSNAGSVAFISTCEQLGKNGMLNDEEVKAIRAMIHSIS